MEATLDQHLPCGVICGAKTRMPAKGVCFRDSGTERAGFELAVRSANFAFEFSAEFPASFAKFGFRENFAPEVLDESIRCLCGPVELRVRGILLS